MSVSILDDIEDSIDFYYDDDFQETPQDIWEHCVVPSIDSSFHILYKLILVNLLFGVIVSTVKLPQILFHILSGAGGIYLLSNLESKEGKILLLMFFITSYLVLFISRRFKKEFYTVKNDNEIIRYFSIPNIIKCALIIILVLCEYFLLETDTWMEIRGIMMIFSMKLISLAEETDLYLCFTPPSLFRYFGYMFCGANVMFGPWISFQEYLTMFSYPTRKSVWWIFGVARAFMISIFFLTISNCLSVYFIPENSNIWLTSYREALSFRTSHYFVSFLSEASMLAAGFKNNKLWNDPKKWRFEVVNPLKIEFPTALSIVVTTWNKPMHDFLKKYVYKSWLPFGKFYGILATFIISSFLHGFELKVSVVLISIGIFSYLQFKIRDYLADAFNCCIRVYPCKDGCTHKYKRNSIVGIFTRLFFSFTTIVHLIYLGMIMDPNTDQVGILQKWRNLYFISFWMMLSNIFFVIFY